MSRGGFSFPPPPPPPPPSTTSINTFQNAHSQSSRGRGGRSAGTHHRGRGRGTGHASRGGYMNGAPAANYTPTQNYPYQTVNNPPSEYNMPGSQRPTVYPVTAYRHAHTASQFPSPQTPYGSPASSPYPPQHQPRHPPHSPTGYPSQLRASPLMPPPPRNASHGSPPMMSPPLRWGFDHPGSSGPYPPQQNYPTVPHQLPRQGHDHQGGYRQQRNFNTYNGFGAYSSSDRPQNRMNKRPHSTAFSSKPGDIRPTAPLPVPSFGNPLPSKPPTAVEATRRPKKKRRKYNQLGLTPKTEEHESSEEEDDADEESKLALQIADNELKVTYRGRTAKLQSAAEIAAWIEERRKRYPTIARIEERKKELEQRKATREARRAEQEELKRQKEPNAKKEREKSKEKTSADHKLDPADAAEKAKLKAEKLRKKLMKEERRVAKAEAAAQKARQAVEALTSHTNGATEVPKLSSNAFSVAGDGQMGNCPESQHISSTSASAILLEKGSREPNNDVNEESTVTEVPIVPDAMGLGITEGSHRVNGRHQAGDQVKMGEGANDTDDDGLSAATSSLDTSDLSDETSSSGSDSSSDDSDDDSAPEQMTSKRERPDRVLPPPRKSKQSCHEFLKTGKCRRGEHCRYMHKMPQQGGRGRLRDKGGGNEQQRRSLFQTLIEQQREDENQRVMQAISWLGERGILDEPAQAKTA
ncbi:hypothetical protein PRK78_003945 [Emydomyces testavorans]|uniref:C3H1-type domain-containing protein n=1 Tax=Emydomyces testavorans TaxID=2070801 RepID=A0AAF0DJ05_9EURO|nr:hypothetical protein PRK78_003945 [Emydomyces testavorans]